MNWHIAPMQLCIFHLIVRHFRINCIEWNISSANLVFGLSFNQWTFDCERASMHTRAAFSSVDVLPHELWTEEKKRKKKFDACRVVHIWTISLNNTNALASYYLFPSCMPDRMLVVAALEPSREKKRETIRSNIQRGYWRVQVDL